MTWNHRIVRKFDGKKEYFEVHEVYYDGFGNPEKTTESGMSPFGNTLNELKEEVQKFLNACEKPILDYKDF